MMMMTMMTLHLYWFDPFFFCVFHFQKEKVYEWMGGGCFFVLLLLALTEALCTFFALLISCLCLSLSLSLCVCVVCCDCELIPIYFYLVFFLYLFLPISIQTCGFLFLFGRLWVVFANMGSSCRRTKKTDYIHPSIMKTLVRTSVVCLCLDQASKLPLLLHQTSGGKKRHQQIKKKQRNDLF
jgi:hypothetical protein